MSEVTITIRGAAAERLQKLVSEKQYDGPEAAVTDAIDALEAEGPADPEFDAWFRDVVIPRADASSDDDMTPDEVQARLFGK